MKGKDKICGDCFLLYVFRVDSVGLNQFNLRKGGAAGKAVGVVVYVWDWILVRDVTRVKGSIVFTGPPTAVLRRHEMVGGRTRAIGSFDGAFTQHGVELDLGDGQAARRRMWHATGGTGVIRM